MCIRDSPPHTHSHCTYINAHTHTTQITHSHHTHDSTHAHAHKHTHTHTHLLRHAGVIPVPTFIRSPHAGLCEFFVQRTSESVVFVPPQAGSAKMLSYSRECESCIFVNKHCVMSLNQKCHCKHVNQIQQFTKPNQQHGKSNQTKSSSTRPQNKISSLTRRDAQWTIKDVSLWCCAGNWLRLHGATGIK